MKPAKMHVSFNTDNVICPKCEEEFIVLYVKKGEYWELSGEYWEAAKEFYCPFCGNNHA